MIVVIVGDLFINLCRLVLVLIIVVVLVCMCRLRKSRIVVVRIVSSRIMFIRIRGFVLIIGLF